MLVCFLHPLQKALFVLGTFTCARAVLDDAPPRLAEQLERGRRGARSETRSAHAPSWLDAAPRGEGERERCARDLTVAQRPHAICLGKQHAQRRLIPYSSARASAKMTEVRLVRELVFPRAPWSKAPPRSTLVANHCYVRAQAWKSHKMHWCDVCRCWLNDTKAAIAHHEAGMGHTANLQRSECFSCFGAAAEHGDGPHVQLLSDEDPLHLQSCATWARRPTRKSARRSRPPPPSRRLRPRCVNSSGTHEQRTALTNS